MIIDQVLIDEQINIFVRINELLYEYDYEEEKYYPFKYTFANVRKCFKLKRQYCVFHDNKLDIFDSAYNLLFDPNYSSIIVNDVYYSNSSDAMVLLSDGRCVIYTNVSKGPASSSCMLLGNGEIEKIFFLGSYLSCYFNGQADYYRIIDGVEHRKSIATTSEEFDRITSMEITHNESNRFFALNKLFYVADGNKLFCTHDPAVITREQMIGFIPSDLIINEITYESNDMTILEVELSKQPIVTSFIANQIITLDSKVYLKSHCITFDERRVVYDNICDERYKSVFTIDIDESDIVNQMMSIIPQIYRLNHSYAYAINMVDKNGNVKSYGSGVNRHVSDIIRNYVDKCLKDLDLEDDMCIRLGKLIFFIAINFQERFRSIHPYFFFLLAKPSDYHYLLSDKLLKYYDEYEKDISKLIDLDLGLSTLEEYVEYVIANDLSAKKKAKYAKIVQGFRAFSYHGPRKEWYNTVPITYYLATLCAPEIVNLKCILPIILKNEAYLIELNKFMIDMMKEYSSEQHAIFVKNITGSSDFDGFIIIMVQEKETDLQYSISSCDATLTFYNNPEMKTVKEILDTLIIPDNTMIN